VVAVGPSFETPPAYAFGDTEPAARRLGLLADLFDPVSRAFLARHTPRGARLAVDLGCGPGHTTRLLAATAGAARTVGLDASAAFLATARNAAARSGQPAGVEFVRHDVRRVPFPETARAADVVYARFLLAHLADVPAVVAAWCGQLGPGGLLLLEETEAIDADQPALHVYIDRVERLLAARGTTVYAGAALGDAVPGRALGRPADGRPVRVVHNATTRLDVPAPQAAGMFALNLAVWRADPLLRDEQPSLDGLAADLDRLHDAGSGTNTESDTSQITWILRQAALRAE
jgi:SAM-dependent methyltransferase